MSATHFADWPTTSRSHTGPCLYKLSMPPSNGGKGNLLLGHLPSAHPGLSARTFIFNFATSCVNGIWRFLHTRFHATHRPSKRHPSNIPQSWTSFAQGILRTVNAPNGRSSNQQLSSPLTLTGFRLALFFPNIYHPTLVSSLRALCWTRSSLPRRTSWPSSNWAFVSGRAIMVFQPFHHKTSSTLAYNYGNNNLN
jgi:hypothetical protein